MANGKILKRFLRTYRFNQQLERRFSWSNIAGIKIKWPRKNFKDQMGCHLGPGFSENFIESQLNGLKIIIVKSSDETASFVGQLTVWLAGFKVG